MGISTGGFLILDLLFSFVPYLLDTGVQIWNAVEVNELTTNPEFQYPTPLYFEENIEDMEYCEEGWTYFPHTKLCYKFVEETTNWDRAKNCLFDNGTYSGTKQPVLVSIHDNITNNFVSNLKLPNNVQITVNTSTNVQVQVICGHGKHGHAWAGGYGIGQGNEGYWLDGKPWVYTNWGNGKPSNTSNGMHEYYLAMVMDYCMIIENGNVTQWLKGQWINLPKSLLLPSLCQYDPVNDPEIYLTRKKRGVKNDSSIEGDIYTFNFSIRISFEGLVSPILVQLPGLALGFLGIMKAFLNHGCSKQALIDSLR